MDVGVSINRVLRVALLQPMSVKHLSPETLSEAIRGMKHSIKVLERNGVSDPDEPDKYGHIVSIKFGNLVETLGSIDQLSVAWQTAITMLEDQVLDLYRKSPPR